MTNLRRYNLGSAASIHVYDSPTGNTCDAREALAIIEALQAEVAAKDTRIERLLADLARGDKRIVELLHLSQSLERRLVNMTIEQELDAMENQSVTHP